MYKEKRKQVQKLLRFRRLAENRASFSLQLATQEVSEANQVHMQAIERMDEVSGWKASMDDRGGIELSLYTHALSLEQVAAVAVGRAAEAECMADKDRNNAADKHRDAVNSTRVADRRAERLGRVCDYQEERKISDAVSDMWLARSRHAGT
jgi:glucose-6-phosphate dehydrogenase assembly protein OpcA